MDDDDHADNCTCPSCEFERELALEQAAIAALAPDVEDRGEQLRVATERTHEIAAAAGVSIERVKVDLSKPKQGS